MAARTQSGPAVSELFPGLVAMAALHDWSTSPDADREARLVRALEALSVAAGARGGVLAIDAPPLPSATLAFGSMRDADADAQSDGQPRELRAGADGTRLGSVLIDADDAPGAIAAHAIGMALDSAWSRAEVRATVDRLEALDEATRGIAEVLDVDRVLQVIVDRVRELVGATYAALGIVRDDGTIERFITSGISDDVRAAIGPPPQGHGLLGLIIRDGRSYRIPDIAAHPDSSGFPPNHPPMTSLLGVPVTLKGRPIGNLYLTDKLGAREFNADDQRLVETFALHAAIAIENARLHEQIQRLAIVEERERISRDLHDGVIQGIYAVAVSLEDVADLMRDNPEEGVERIDRAIDSLNLTIRDIRNFILGLRSEFLGGADLDAGLATLAQDFGLNTPIDVKLELSRGRLAARDLAVDDRVQLLQMTREALSNAARHGKARTAIVRLDADDESVTLTVEDDGVGFDPAAVVSSGHLGLANLRDRAARMGGFADVDSRPGAGARIIIRLPRREG